MFWCSNCVDFEVISKILLDITHDEKAATYKQKAFRIINLIIFKDRIKCFGYILYESLTLRNCTV